MQEKLNAVLAGRYEIQHELGSGGMATVYLADDLEHDRKVAIKVLHPDLAASLGTERFLREIEIAGKLTHPNILPVHDSGEVDGILFYVMPYVAGESLADLLRRETHLGVEEALAINSQVAAGLEHAHKQGIVHRDIKPDNILLADGHAVIADFGIARALTQAGADKLTQTGLAVGTPKYMSPEQASASPIDARTDIYSMACVLYEMLAGAPPFTASTPQALMARHAIDPVPSLSTVRDTVPPAVETAIARALAKVPADRFATATAFVEALTRTDVVAASPTSAPDQNSIAVLPFSNMSSDPENEYFSDGMAEEILNALTRIPNLRVSARTSSFTFKGKDADVGQIGRQLKVAKVLEGSIRQAGNRLRITAQLINASDGYHIWSERYDREMTDVFAIQDELTLAIVEALKVRLGGDEAEPKIRRGTEDLEAYRHFLRGRHYWESRALPKALECFQQAIERDPGYAAPYAGVADVFSYFGHYGVVPTPQAAAKAMGAAERAVALDDESADAHFSLGLAKLCFWELDEAEPALRRAIALNPQHAVARTYLGVHLATTCRPAAEVRDAVEPALEIEPLSPIVNCVAGIAYFWAGEFSRAIEVIDRALEIEPTLIPGLYMQGSVLSKLGNPEAGVAALTKAAELLPCPLVLMMLGGAFADAGQPEKAQEIVARLKTQREESYATPLSIGYVMTKLGELEEAVDWMERAFAERNTFAWSAGSWPGMESLASHPRYRAAMERAGLGHLIALGS